jgi:hypothetical protein
MLSPVSPTPLCRNLSCYQLTPTDCKDVVTLCVSYSADHLNARSYLAAASAILGAVGFITSALLPVTSFKVSSNSIPSSFYPLPIHDCLET